MSVERIRFFIMVPVVVFAAALLSEYSGFDLWLASLFFDVRENVWPYRRAFWPSDVLHTGGRVAAVLVALVNIGLLVASYRVKSLLLYRRHLAFVLLVAVLGPSIVSILKATTHIYTPWDLQLFGGHRPYVRLFDPAPAGLPPGHAFPGGHSSGGFAFIGLYFVLALHGHPMRHKALAAILLLGGAFAVGQEIRGAHLLSHDLTSFSICWSISLMMALLVYRSKSLSALDGVVPKDIR